MDEWRTVPGVARWLHMRVTDARAWLMEHDLIRTIAGRERVYLPSVLAVIEGGRPSAEPEPESARKLTRSLAIAPLPVPRRMR